MFKTIASASILAGVQAQGITAKEFFNESWWLPSEEFTAFNKSFADRYYLKGRYGPNNMGYWGQYAYIYLEVGGDEIADGAVVTTWATIERPVEYTTKTDPFTGAVTQEQVQTGVPYTQTETAECRMVYRKEPDEDVPESWIETLDQGQM